jgi:hypothetical protein
MIIRLILVAICVQFGIGILIAPTVNGLQAGRLIVAGVFLIAAWLIFAALDRQWRLLIAQSDPTPTDFI